MRKIAIYGIIIFQVILIASLIRGIQTSQKSKDRLADLEKRKSELANQNTKLRQEKEYVQSPYYLEKLAREELHLVKPGETVVIIPEGEQKPKTGEVINEGKEGKQNWEKWLAVLVK